MQHVGWRVISASAHDDRSGDVDYYAESRDLPLWNGHAGAESVRAALRGARTPPRRRGEKTTGVSDLIASFSLYSLPLEWRADASRAQLVVCLGEVRKRDAMPIGTCEWDIAKGDVYPARYTFEVYEAKTGRSLATFPIVSNTSADASCPPTVHVRPGEGRVAVAQGVTEQTLVSKLKPLVMQDAG